MKLETVSIGELKPHPKNPRVHPDSALDKLVRSISEFGWTNPVLVDADGRILAGHARVKAAAKAGMTEVPVIRLPLSGAKADAYLIADNRIQDETDWDMPLLKDLLQDLDTGEMDLTLTGFDLDEIEQMMTATPQGDVEQDEVPEPPANPITKPGDLWILGRHRLLCGDSTKAKDVERVMDGAKADMVLTDPPYGVAYTGKTSDALEIENDDLDESGLHSLITLAFDNAQHTSRPGAHWYATVPPGPLHLLFALDWKQRGILRQIMVWAKDSMVLGHSEYHYRHEPILFGWVPGKRHLNSDRTRTTLWEYARPKVSRDHPTMKPVALWAQAINDGSHQNECVYDSFLGSGTTLIAAEQLGRTCYGMEISPAYCDVVVKRWENLTGQKAVRDDGQARST